MTSMATAPLHPVPVAVNALPGTRNVNEPLMQVRFKRLSADLLNLSCTAHGLNQAQDDLTRTLPRRTRKGVAMVSSQAVAEAEPLVVEKIEAEESSAKVVIVGAGIAGLSAAISLHRVGVKVRVLEQSSSIRASGTSLSLWTNAWRALEYMGVADGLRDKHTLVTEINMYDLSENLLKRFEFKECPEGPHEVRGVERKLLVESLAAQLPPGTIQFNSRVRKIRREPGEGLTKVELENGSVLSTKLLVGCDGVNSVVGKWMGLPPTRYVGQLGIRGVAEYPNGHDFANRFVQYLGVGERFGIFPLSDSKVYWFLSWCSSSPGPKVTDGSLCKAEALRLVQAGWPERVKELVTNTPVECVSRSGLADRWNIPGVTPALIKEGVTVAGDAMHPMTPSLGQGGGTAIEDGIVLAQTLGAALSQVGDNESIQKALEDYAVRRQKRTFPITVKAFILGAVFQSDFPPMMYLRNNWAIPKLVGPSSFLSHTLFDVGKLPTSTVNAKYL